jgi:hypothetical protein
MKNGLLILLGLCLVGVAAGCRVLDIGGGLPEGNLVDDKDSDSIPVTMAAAPVVVDGKLTDAAWVGAIAMTDFISGRSGKPPVGTRVLVTYDKDNLYIAVINEETETDSLVAKAEERDGNVWSDDSDEIYLDPRNEKAGEYYGFFVNPKNVVYDRRRVEAWDGDWTSATQVLPGKAWIAEIAIPFQTVGVTPRPGHKLGLMVARNHHAAQTQGKQFYLVPCAQEAKDTTAYPVLELR